MVLTLHGTGAGTPNGDRAASCLTAAFADGSLVQFDAGDGCVRAMIRDGIDINRIVKVLVSHMHADHWAGLPGLIMGWGTCGRTAPVELFVPARALDFLKEAQMQSLAYKELMPFKLRYRKLQPLMLPEGWRVDLFKTTHLAKVKHLARRHGAASTAYGYVLRNGELKIVLSQDLGGEDDLRGVIVDADLVICESAHVDTARTLQLVRDAGVRRLIFTHVPPKNATFPDHFDGIEWSIARDGDRVEIP